MSGTFHAEIGETLAKVVREVNGRGELILALLRLNSAWLASSASSFCTGSDSKCRNFDHGPNV